MRKPSQRFYITLKAVIVDHGTVLLAQAHDGRWEFPGGRIDPGEELVPLHDILRREIREELGEEFTVSIGPLINTWTVLYKDDVYGLALEHRCEYMSGPVVLSDEHIDYRWVTEKDWKELPLVGGNTSGMNMSLEAIFGKHSLVDSAL